ncbi:ATP-binding protein [Geomonas paludis]|uniref:ATP-binding protein n=1 Tax=Geomonas paludis TaxID=2740185 RepID=A0A6V8MSW2_9BACT|nr:ATP-binding protein [Geomonas paludis]UPU38221.1 ATP-binding protein [Geomonas paludis]GFO63246.1 molecular chaperone HtpG [Geomonas paludis]
MPRNIVTNTPLSPSLADGPELFQMETDLDGILILLGESLYSSPDVFIRELLQNCHDALVLRRRSEPNLAGHICITTSTAEKSITFRENGIGMDYGDIRHVFSVIGSSGKRGGKGLADLRTMAETELIGQFGIGFLSAFTVAARVEVFTRKAGDDCGWHWTNCGSLQCALEPSARPETGTEVTLFLRDEYDFLLDEEYLSSAVVRYGNFLPFPISLNGMGPVNAVNAPWHRTKGEPSLEQCRAFIESAYHDFPIEVIPVLPEGGTRARGVLYITGERVPDYGAKGTVDLYVRRMFVTSGSRHILPPWAKFVKGVIDCPDLKPTASRDGIKDDDPATVELSRHLGDLIVRHLRTLAEANPERFARLVDWHHYHLKGMACLYPEFFREIAPYLPLPTSRGTMTLRHCLAAAREDAAGKAVPVLYYQKGEGAFSQFRRMAQSRGWLVVDASLPLDASLLKSYAGEHRGQVTLVRVDAGDPPGLFAALEPVQEERFRLLEGEIAGRLRRMGVERLVVRTRSFEPADIPALVMHHRDDEDLDDLRHSLGNPGISEAARMIAGDLLSKRKIAPVTLTLNARNPAVARLVDLARWQRLEDAALGWDAGLLDALLGSLFTTALMASGGSGKEEGDLLRQQLGGLFRCVLRLLEKHDEQQDLITRLEQQGGTTGLRHGLGDYNC